MGFYYFLFLITDLQKLNAYYHFSNTNKKFEKEKAYENKYHNKTTNKNLYSPNNV